VVVYFREPKGHPEKWRAYLNFRTVADTNVAKAAANPIMLDGQDYEWTEYWRREDDVRTGAHAFRVRDAREQHRSRHTREITPATNAARRSPENDRAGLATATMTSPRMRPSERRRTDRTNSGVLTTAAASSVLSSAVAWTPASTCTSLDAAPTMTYASSTMSTNVSTPVSGHTSLDVIYSSSSPGSEAAPLTSELVQEPLVCPSLASSCTLNHPPEGPPSSISMVASTKRESGELGYIAALNANFPDRMSEEELDIRLYQPPVQWVRGNKILEMMVRCRAHGTLHQFCPVVVRRTSTSVVVC
jgi:hypothetical protein